MQHVESKTVVNIVVVGAGPTGLAEIAELLKQAQEHPDQHFNIHVIEKRDINNLIRRQKIIDFPDQLVANPQEQGWEGFCKNLFDPYEEWELNDEDKLVANNVVIEELNQREKLIAKLLRLTVDKTTSSYKNFSVKDLQAALLEHIFDTSSQLENVNMNWHNKSVIESVDIKHKLIFVEDEDKPVTFDALLIAEGVKRKTTKLINSEIEKQDDIKPFIFNDFSKQPGQFHGAVRLRLKPLREIENGKYKSYLELQSNFDKDEIKSEAYSSLNQLGWNPFPPAAPDFILDSNVDLSRPLKKDPRIYMAGVIPEAIYKIQDVDERRTALIEWFKQVAAFDYGLPADYFEFDDKGETDTLKLNATVFSMPMNYVDSPVRLTKEGAFIALLGDSAMSPLYPAGFSSKIGLNLAIAIAHYLASEKKAEDLQNIRKLYQLYKEEINRSLGLAKYKKQKQPGLFSKTSNEDATIQFHELIQRNDSLKIEDLKSLLLLGANPNKKLKHDTPLFIAVTNGNLDLVKFLLQEGADPNKKSLFISPLVQAIKLNKDDIIKTLLEYGADLNETLDELSKTDFPFQVDAETLTTNQNNTMQKFVTLFDVGSRFEIADIPAENRLIKLFYEAFSSREGFDFFLGLQHDLANPQLILLYHLLATKKIFNTKNEQREPTDKESAFIETNLEYMKKLLNGEADSKQIPIYLRSTDKLRKEVEAIESPDHVESVTSFVKAMVEKHFGENDHALYITDLKKSADKKFIPAMIELGKFYAKNDRYKEARVLFTDAAVMGSSVAFIELAALIEKHPFNQLDLYSSYAFIDKGNHSSTLYYDTFHSSLHEKLEELGNQLQLNYSDPDIFVRINLFLDLAMSDEYNRLRQYSMQTKSQTKTTMELLTTLAKEFIATTEIDDTYERIKAIYNAVKKAQNSLDQNFSSAFYEKLEELAQITKEIVLKDFPNVMAEKYGLPTDFTTQLKP